MVYLSGLYKTTISGTLSTSRCRGRLSKECKVHHFFVNRSAFPIPRGLCRNIEDQGVILLEDVCQLDWIGAGRFAAHHPHPTSKAFSHNASAETKIAVTWQRGFMAVGFKSCKTCWTSFLIYHRFWYCPQARKVYLSVDSGRIEDMVHMAAPWYIRYPTQRTPEKYSQMLIATSDLRTKSFKVRSHQLSRGENKWDYLDTPLQLYHCSHRGNYRYQRPDRQAWCTFQDKKSY